VHRLEVAKKDERKFPERISVIYTSLPFYTCGLTQDICTDAKTRWSFSAGEAKISINLLLEQIPPY